MENIIDGEYIDAVIAGKVSFEKGSPDAAILAMLNEAAKRKLAGQQGLARAQQSVKLAQEIIIRADADEEAAARLLTILKRARAPAPTTSAEPSAPSDAPLPPNPSPEMMDAKGA